MLICMRLCLIGLCVLSVLDVDDEWIFAVGHNIRFSACMFRGGDARYDCGHTQTQALTISRTLG